jgi:hypothetical protein
MRSKRQIHMSISALCAIGRACAETGNDPERLTRAEWISAMSIECDQDYAQHYQSPNRVLLSNEKPHWRLEFMSHEHIGPISQDDPGSDGPGLGSYEKTGGGKAHVKVYEDGKIEIGI